MELTKGIESIDDITSLSEHKSPIKELKMVYDLKVDPNPKKGYKKISQDQRDVNSLYNKSNRAFDGTKIMMDIEHYKKRTGYLYFCIGEKKEPVYAAKLGPEFYICSAVNPCAFAYKENDTKLCGVKMNIE